MQKLQTLLAIIVFIIAVSIAVPSFSFSLPSNIAGGRSFNVRNIELSDFGVDTPVTGFNYQPALDLQGGSALTYRLTFDENLSTEERSSQFNQTKDIIATRMALIGLKDYEFTTFINEKDNIYKIVLITPTELEENLAQVIISPGVLDVLIGTKAEEENPEESANTLFPGTKSSGITNSDISRMRVVSDSRVFSNDPENPNNFGLEIAFTNDGEKKVIDALIENSGSNYPLIFTLDGALVATQTGGQQLNVAQGLNNFLLYTYFADNEINNAVIGAVMTTPNISTDIQIESTTKISPTLGEKALSNLKLAVPVSALAVYFLLLLIARKKGLYIAISAAIFSVLLIAVQKSTAMNLSFALITSFITILLIFSHSQVRIIHNAFKLKSKKQLNEFIENNSLSTWESITRLIVIILLILFLTNLLTVSANQFVQTILSGLVVWVLFKALFLKPLLLFIINTEK